MSKRLYVVEVRYVGIVYAESPREAEGMRREIVGWEDPCAVESETLDPSNPERWPKGWDEGCLVYHEGEGDISIADVIAEQEAP